MGKFIDLTGQKFNKLTVISRNFEKQKQLNNCHAFWNCICECGRQVVVAGISLKSGNTKSCGCYNTSMILQRGKENKKTNRYDLSNDEYGIGYTSNGEAFIFDKEDFEKIKPICWHIQKGYLVGLLNGKRINMQRYLMGIQAGDHRVVDHENNNKKDNRKENLRICTQHQNSMNRKMNSNNKSGHKGVSYNKRDHKWCARIKYNYKSISLGSYDTMEGAIAAREKAERELFGEFAYKGDVNE